MPAILRGACRSFLSPWSIIRLIFITPRFTFEVMERDPAKGTLITRIPVNEIYRDGNVACTYVDKLFTHIYMGRFLCQPGPPLQKRKNQFHWKRITVWLEELACRSGFTRWKSITVHAAVGPTTVPIQGRKGPRGERRKRLEFSVSLMLLILDSSLCKFPILRWSCIWWKNIMYPNPRIYYIPQEEVFRSNAL